MTAHPEKKDGMRKDKGERRGVCDRKWWGRERRGGSWETQHFIGM